MRPQLIFKLFLRRLRLIFSWLLFAFSGYLATDQTLQLWDRMLGFNSLVILPGNFGFFKLIFFLILPRYFSLYSNAIQPNYQIKCFNLF